MKKVFLSLGIVFLFSSCSQEKTEEYHGYYCLDEYCTEHKTGYTWGKKNKIDDAKKCEYIKSQQFREGCLVWVNEKNAITEQTPLPANTEGVNYQTVKYRETGAVNVAAEIFEPIKNTDDTVKNAWYSSTHEYLIITLGTTNYQYCRFPESIWARLSYSGGPYNVYTDEIRGRYDCREGGEF